jgi:hypothetical protein
VHANHEFDALQSFINDMPRAPRLNITSADEHVPEVERCIRVIKERVRAIRHSLPFDQVPQMITIHMVLHVVKILNYFPTKRGISATWSPRMIMAGKPLNYNKELAVQFGTYCQVHIQPTPCNRFKARTVGAICLGPSENKQGGCRFLNLTSGNHITGYKWNELSMPDSAIRRVNLLGKDQPKVLK